MTYAGAFVVALAITMDSVKRLSSCRFEPLVDVPLPTKALVWTAKHYYDGSSKHQVAAALVQPFTAALFYVLSSVFYTVYERRRVLQAG